jgi:lysophospholipase L1-like esterase
MGFGALELVARGLEAGMPAMPLRPLPAPGAADCMPDCMPGVAAMPEQPRGLPRGIPMVPHGRRAWALPPNTVMVETNVAVRVNALALRGPPIVSRAADELRVLTLGDSSVFGFGVAEENVFGQVAARALMAQLDRPVSAVNGGTPGYTSVQALDTLMDVGRQVDPTHVVIAVLWSDLFQTETPIERGGGQRHPLALYRVGTRLLAPWLPAAKVGWTEGDVGAIGAGRSARVGLERYRETLDRLVAQTRSLNAEPVVVILPAPIDLDDVGPPSLISLYRAELEALAVRHDLILVDGPAYFLENGATNADFYDQVHPSTSGHGLLGTALYGALSGINHR